MDVLLDIQTDCTHLWSPYKYTIVIHICLHTMRGNECFPFNHCIRLKKQLFVCHHTIVWKSNDMAFHCRPSLKHKPNHTIVHQAYHSSVVDSQVAALQFCRGMACIYYSNSWRWPMGGFYDNQPLVGFFNTILRYLF